MVEIVTQRRGDALVPVSEADRQVLILLPERRFITISAEPKAPLKLQRWFHAMLALLVEATGRWPTVAIAKREILIRTGFFSSMVISTNGDSRITPESTAEWGLVEWRLFLDRALPFIVENYVGETRAQFRDRVDAFVGIKYKDAIDG